MTQRDQLISWINDAYSMESQLVPILRAHANQADGMPEAQRRIERHVEETEMHARRMEKAVQLLGSSASRLESSARAILGTADAMAHGIGADLPLKNAMTDYSAEAFEVAAYRALVMAAERAGEPQVAALCRQNLEEDQAMGDWLRDHLDEVVAHAMLSAA